MTLSLLEISACLAVLAGGMAAGADALDPVALTESAETAYVVMSEKSVETTYSAYYVRYGMKPTAEDLMRTGYVAEDADRATVEAAVAKMDRRAALAGL